MSQQLEQMIEMAATVRANAHAPYSNFKVGAVVRAANGLYAGANVENAAYPVGWCAEPSAISAMIAAGDTRILEIVVMGDGPELCTPCGGCRQKLREFADVNVEIHVCGPEGLRRTFTLGELLPYDFGPGHLK
jgi:cytidine deaminase